MIESDFYGFAKQSKKEWLELVSKDLRGKDFEEALVSKLWEKIKVEPMYFLDQPDSEMLFHPESEIPGMPPRVWTNLASVEVSEEKIGNGKALKLLNQGAEGLIFLVKADTDFKILLKDIQLEFVEIFITPLSEPGRVISDFQHFLDNSEFPKTDLKGGLLWSPTSSAIKTGQAPDYDLAKRAIEIFEDYPDFKALTIDFSRYAEAGGNGLQELTFGLGEIIETLDQIGELGNKILWQNLIFHLSSGSEYFAEIAKLKAARVLICELANLYGLEYKLEDVHLLVSNNHFTKTQLDPYSNLIRQTFEGMAAILGGVNSLWIKAEIGNRNQQLFERMAINVSTILRDESQLGKVMDPSAGSYFISKLTEDIKEKVLDSLKSLEQNGGWLSSFEKGILQSEIRETREQIQKKVLDGELTKVGGNKYLLPSQANSPQELEDFEETQLQLKPSRASYLVENKKES
ncbi:methylmalonyl-CoA mutase family protein [Algoriphagus sediminis]|uniref:Methylmalonyl-CoA mutase family protein n=1 Tax=Algoriphagus sediminis TaxID=3057113 RepID=A0ABT7YGS4_9BACT|nr:methylmalonyl-CoA mutase family protein [Algoriphagus sediminis]MDN3205545.1 methylmalonyl-CoA mutase family protein [Algoriphagus sediminis]